MSNVSHIPSRTASPDSYNAGFRWLTTAFHPILVDHPYIAHVIACSFQLLSSVERDGHSRDEFVREISGELWETTDSWTLRRIRSLNTPHAYVAVIARRLDQKRYRSRQHPMEQLGATDHEVLDPRDELERRSRHEHVRFCIELCLRQRDSRDEKIIRQWLDARSQKAIASAYQLTEARISQIVRSFQQCVRNLIDEDNQ